MLLEPVMGSANRERVLVFLWARRQGYAREIVRFYDCALLPIQQQLERLESAGVLVSREAGRTVMYEFNPRYALLEELGALLEKALSFYPEEIQEALLKDRRRPRRRGKPL